MIHDHQSIASQRNEVVIPEYPNVSTPVLLLFCSYVIIWYLQVGSRISFLGRIRIELIVACLLLPLALMTHSKSKTEMDSSLFPIIIVYFILLLMMTLFSYDFQTSWNVFFNRVVKFAFMSLFIVCFVKSPTGMRFFLVAFMLACMKMGQEGLVGQLTGSLVWQNQGVMRLHGSTELYRHPNSFAGMALGAIPFIMYFFPIVNKWLKGVLLAQLVLALNIILFTGSRTGWIGFIGICSVFFFRSKHKHKVKLFLLLIIGTILAMNYVPMEYQERFSSIYRSGTDSSEGALQGGEGSKSARIQIMKDAVEIFIEHPFGVGVAAFPAIRTDRFGRSPDTHNLYLEIATNLGVQGLLLFAVLIFCLFRSLLKNRDELSQQVSVMDKKLLEESHTPPQKKLEMKHYNDLKLIVATCDSVILFISLRLMLGIFGMDLYEIYWWFGLGLTIAINNMAKVTKLRTDYLLCPGC